MQFFIEFWGMPLVTIVLPAKNLEYFSTLLAGYMEQILNDLCRRV